MTELATRTRRAGRTLGWTLLLVLLAGAAGAQEAEPTLDTGPVFARAETDIADATTDQLTRMLASLGAELLVETRESGWVDDDRACRSAYRFRGMPNTQYRIIGFRVVCEVSGE